MGLLHSIHRRTGTVTPDPNALPGTASTLRRVFDLDSVALLRPTDRGWEIDEAVGTPVPQQPEQAQFSIELPDGRLLAITGSRLQDEDAELLQTLLATVRQIRERAQANRIAPS